MFNHDAGSSKFDPFHKLSKTSFKLGVKADDQPTLPQIGVNPTSSELLVFQHFWSFVTEIRSPMLANKFYKGGFFVKFIHFCCITNYQSISLIHHGIIALPSLDIFLTKCDLEKHVSLSVKR